MASCLGSRGQGRTTLSSTGETDPYRHRLLREHRRLLERHYGTLLDGAHAGIAGRLDALEAELEQADREAA